MSFQISRARERFVTQRTVKPLKLVVSSSVCGQVRLASERFRTLFARIWTFPRVGSHVKFNVRPDREPTITNGASVRTFASVGPKMAFQVVFFDERQTAERTFVGTFARVDGIVKF